MTAIQKAREALNKIASWTQTEGLLWWQVEARSALAALDAETPATPADVGELVERLRARLEHTFDYATQGAEWQNDALCQEAATALERVVRERDEARSIVRDIHWMAVRYADNRKSYAVGMCNDALRKAYDGGWLSYRDDKQHDLDPQYARDGMFDAEWRSAVDAATVRAESAEAKLAEALADRAAQAERIRELEEALRKAREGLNAGCAQYAVKTIGDVEIPGDAQYPWVRKMQIGRDAAARALSQEGSDAL